MKNSDFNSSCPEAGYPAERLVHSSSTTIEGTSECLKTLLDIRNVAAVGTTTATVATASGAGIMGTLASTGAVVGGGVVAGVGLTAGGGAFAAANLMNNHLYNGDTQADQMARRGTYAGAGLGTAASLGTLAVTGAGPAGLATIGATVGGGMAAGAMVVLVAPIAAATAIGASLYWLFKGNPRA